MIIDSTNSKTKLMQFFHEDPALTELNIPELTKIDTLTTPNAYLNALYINSPVIKTIKFDNLEQSPFVLNGENLSMVSLNRLKQIEQKQISSQGINNIISPYSNTIQYNFLCNTKITSLDLPNFEGIMGNINSTDYGASGSSGTVTPSFSYNYWLKDVSLGSSLLEYDENNPTHLSGYWFANCYFLKYLRLQYPYFIPISSNQGLKSTAIDNIGKIYVPRRLLGQYKGENGFNNGQWADFTNKFATLEQYELDKATDSEITDSWATIIDVCNNGNAYEHYRVGDYKTIYVNGTPTQMVIVNIDSPLIHNLSKDVRPNGSYAQITWMERTISRFNQYYITSTIKNYPAATSYQAIMTDIWDHLDGPEATILKGDNGIKTVVKHSEGILDNNINSYSGEFKIWPPSLSEIGLRNINQAYNYFIVGNYENINCPNYRLGDTKIYTNVSIALRDFQNKNSLSPATLVSGLDGSHLEETPTVNPYIIFGFCT